MATRLYFTDNQQPVAAGIIAQPGIHRGYQVPNLVGTMRGMVEYGLGTVRQSSGNGTTVTSVAGPTNGLELGTASAVVNEFVSMPLAADVTISGLITFNVWGRQPVDVNATWNVLIERQTPDGTLTGIRIATSTNSTELTVNASTNAVLNTQFGSTSTAWKKGDRIRAVIFLDDVVASTMVAGQACNIQYGTGTDATNGDTWIEFTENLTFQTVEPTGSILYLTDTDPSHGVPPVTGFQMKEMWSARGTGVITASRATQTGWAAPAQWQKIGGDFVEWYSKPLNAFTLDGLVRFNLPALESSAAANASLKAELAVCDRNGANAVVWCAGCIIDSTVPGGRWISGTSNNGELLTVESPMRAWMAGNATAVATGQRLRFRAYVDDCSETAMAAGNSVSLFYNGTTALASGDAWIQLPQSVTYDGSPPEQYVSISTSWGRWTARADGRRTAAPSATASVTTWDGLATVASNWSIVTERAMSNLVPPSQWVTGVNTYGLRFTPIASGKITHIRYYCYKTTSAHTLSLWRSSDQVQLGSVVDPSGGAAGWREVALPTPIDVVAGAEYRASQTVVPADYCIADGAAITYVAPHLTGFGNVTAAGADTYPANAGGYSYYVDVVFLVPSWLATSTATVFTPAPNWPATISTNWGTWNAAATAVRETAATTSVNWGTWNAAAVAVPTHIATAVQAWGTWTGTATAVVSHTATSSQTWGTWTGTATAVRETAATSSMTWGTWTGTATAIPTVNATSTQSWGTWNAQASATSAPPFIPAVITTVWGTWTATASARRTSDWSTASAARTQPSYSDIPATVTTVWGPLITSATAIVTRAAAISTNWGTWTATGVIAFMERNATISTNWGTWLATGGGIDEHPATGTQAWGTWTATATAVVTHIATISTLWGTWTATATAQPPEHPATIASSWGGWAATAVAGVNHPATIVTVWGWNATATASVEHTASVASAWGTWTATANALHEVYAGITTTWPLWVATATAAIDAKINTNWGSWTATATAIDTRAASISTLWGTWTATATAVRGTFATTTDTWVSTWVATATVGRSASISTVWNTSGSSFSPNDIPGLALWLETDALLAGELAAWPNPGSAADAPIYASPNPMVVSAQTPSGLPVVRFKTGEGRVRMYSTGVTNNFTLVYVGRMTPGAVNWIGRVVNGIYSPNNILFGYWNGFEDVAYDSGFAGPNTQTAVTSNWHMYSADGVPGLDRFFANGVEMGQIPTAQGWGGTLAISGYDPTTSSETCDCDVAGVLLYDNKLSDSVRQQAEGYMRTKYLDPAGLPAGGAWVATATATVVHTSTISTPWGSWTATATADPISHTASINTNWGTWSASALGSQLGQAVAFITTVWPAWTATATAQPILHYGTVNSVWAWSATATAGVEHPASSVQSWGTWTGAATAQPIQRNGTITDVWGWTATATAVIGHTASVSTNWGTWAANATGTIVAEEIFATVATNWGTWTATGFASVVRNFPAQITSNWGTWSATAAAAGLDHPATITTTFGLWTATATADASHVASISTTWGPLVATASALVSHSASISTTWSWTATATAKRETWATISTTWDATFTATAVTSHTATGYSNFGRWEATAFGIAAPRGTTLNEADMVYLGDEAVDRIFLDGVIVWELV
jgi:hypothetical protein